MTDTYPLDPIEYLIERRFPDYKWLRSPSPLTRSRVPPVSQEAQQKRRKRMDEILAYRKSLEDKPQKELNRLVLRALEIARKEQQIRLKQEEQDRFFNQPDAAADFNHWSKATYWTLDEALALAFGKAPEVVTWTKVEPHVDLSPFARQYARVRDLAIRAKNWQQLFDPVLPSIFLAWARRTEIGVPEELVKAVEARGIVIADWKDLYDKLRVQFDALAEDRREIGAICQQAIEQRDAFRARVAELEEQAAAWQFDESSDTYPAELDAAMMAWRAVSNQRDSSMTVKQQILAWLGKTYPKLSEEARERIATVCNWEKRGGRPSQDQ